MGCVIDGLFIASCPTPTRPLPAPSPPCGPYHTLCRAHPPLPPCLLPAPLLHPPTHPLLHLPPPPPGIPVSKLVESEREKLLNLGEELHK